MASHGVARPIQARTEGQRLQELDKIRTYRELEDQIRVQAESGTYDLALLQLTTKLLRLSPEYFTVWNVRRRCLISGLLSGRSGGALPSKASPSTSPNATTGPGPSSDASSLSSSDEFQPDQHSSTSMATADPHESDGNVLQSELAFTVPLLLRFPKSYWIWNFRRWILSQVILRLPVPIARKVWETELGLAAEMLDKDQRNFHAWAYRRYVVAKLESPELQGKSMAEDEFAYTTKLIGLDLSNFSAWHNRSQVVLRVLDERGADDEMRAAFLDKELSTVLDALNVGPDDQTLTVDERAAYLRREIDNIKDLLEDYGGMKRIYEGLLDCTLALQRLGQSEEHDGGGFWLAKLQALDTLHTSRWNAVERATRQ